MNIIKELQNEFISKWECCYQYIRDPVGKLILHCTRCLGDSDVMLFEVELLDEKYEKCVEKDNTHFYNVKYRNNCSGTLIWFHFETDDHINMIANSVISGGAGTEVIAVGKKYIYVLTTPDYLKINISDFKMTRKQLYEIRDDAGLLAQLLAAICTYVCNSPKRIPLDVKYTINRLNAKNPKCSKCRGILNVGDMDDDCKRCVAYERDIHKLKKELNLLLDRITEEFCVCSTRNNCKIQSDDLDGYPTSTNYTNRLDNLDGYTYMFKEVVENHKKLKELEEEYQGGVYDRELELDEEEQTLKKLCVEIEEYNSADD